MQTPIAVTLAEGGAGAAAVVLRTAGTQTLTALDGAGLTWQGSVAIRAGPAAQLAFVDVPSNAILTQRLNVSVRALDAFGNRAEGYAGTVALSTTDAGATLPPPHTFLAPERGEHADTGALAFATAGAQMLTATATAGPSLPAITAPVTVTHGCAPFGPTEAFTSGVFVWSQLSATFDRAGNLVTTVPDSRHELAATGPMINYGTRTWRGSQWEATDAPPPPPPALSEASTLFPFSHYAPRVGTTIDSQGRLLMLADALSDRLLERSYGTWTALPGPDAPNYLPYPDDRTWLTTDSADTVWTAWKGDNGGPAHVRALDRATSTWSLPGNSDDTVPGTARAETRIAMALDPSGAPLVAWSSEVSGNREIYVARYAAGAWAGLAGSDTGSGISATAGVSDIPRLAFDGTGHPMVAWEEDVSGVTAVYLRRFDGTAWSELAGSSSGLGLSNQSDPAMLIDMVSDSQGRPVVLWGIPTNTGPCGFVMVGRFDQGTWGTVFDTSDGSCHFHGYGPGNDRYWWRLLVDSDDRPVLVWINVNRDAAACTIN